MPRRSFGSSRSLRPESDAFYEDLVSGEGGPPLPDWDGTLNEEHQAAEAFYDELVTGRPRAQAPRRAPPAPRARGWEEHYGETTTPTVFTIPAGSPLGTARTPAPIATISPQRQMNEALDNDLIAIAKAKILAPWIDRKFSTNVSQILADSALRQQLDLRNDAALKRRLRPWANNAIPHRRSQLFSTDAFLQARLEAPTTEVELRPVLRLMHFYGLVLLPGAQGGTRPVSDVMASVSRTGARLERQRFDQTTPRIEAFAPGFKQKIARGALTDEVITRTTMPQSWSPSLATNLRRLAAPVVELLTRLRTRNDKWNVGLYTAHWWNEFSADVYLKTGLNAQQFYTPSAVTQFFDDLDATCRSSSGTGPFAWKGIYNDEPLRAQLNTKFGAGRVLRAPKHGPGPDIHIHLDLRPLQLTADDKMGFRLERGNVVLL